MKLPFAITRKSILILVIVCLCGVVHYETIPPHELYPDTLNMIEAGGLYDRLPHRRAGTGLSQEQTPSRRREDFRL